MICAKLMEDRPERGNDEGRDTYLDIFANIQIQDCDYWLDVIFEIERGQGDWRGVHSFFE